MLEVMTMSALILQLSQYAKYHRDKRNILTHFVGVPLILLSIDVLLAKPGIAILGLTITPALLLSLLVGGYYLRLDRGLGLQMAGLLAGLLWASTWLVAVSGGLWWLSGLGLFIVGWVIQFIGHYYEGRKPAFFDDLRGLLIGPLFVWVELLFLLGLYPSLQQAISDTAGPVR